MVIFSFKRRTASRQAVSRKVEGTEPRNRRIEKGDILLTVEAKMSTFIHWQGDAYFSGVRDQGMLDIMITRQPGRPCAFFLQREYAGQLKREEGKKGTGSRMV